MSWEFFSCSSISSQSWLQVKFNSVQIFLLLIKTHSFRSDHFLNRECAKGNRTLTQRRKIIPFWNIPYSWYSEWIKGVHIIHADRYTNATCRYKTTDKWKKKEEKTKKSTKKQRPSQQTIWLNEHESWKWQNFLTLTLIENLWDTTIFSVKPFYMTTLQKQNKMQGSG